MGRWYDGPGLRTWAVRPGSASRTAREFGIVQGFEATGPERLLRGAVEHAAGLVFAQALPPGVQFSLDDSQSYAHWLGQRPA